MVDVENEIIAAGAEIIWVLEEDIPGDPGTAQACMEFLDFYGATQGWCVGDAHTLNALGMPVPGTFDDSPFSVGRGFDIVVPRSTMTIEYTTNHGTVGGNENPSGHEVLAAVEAVIAGLP